MKKAFLLLIITLFSIYGYSQTLDKTNKRYEAFLAKQKNNPELKLVSLHYQILNDKITSSQIDLLRSKLHAIEEIIDYSITNSTIIITFYDNFSENNILMIFKDCLIETTTKKKTYYDEN